MQQGVVCESSTVGVSGTCSSSVTWLALAWFLALCWLLAPKHIVMYSIGSADCFVGTRAVGSTVARPVQE